MSEKENPMQQPYYDYKRFAVLYVDDEEKSLKYFREAFKDRFQVKTASDARQALAELEANVDGIGILMTDQRMPGEKGVQLLERARQINPKIIRILVTAYSDLETAVEAVNTGAIYKYITKPWDLNWLETTLMRGLEFFMVQRERDALLREKMSALHQMVVADRLLSLGIVGSRLSLSLRNSLTAVRDFLDLAPSKLQSEVPDIHRLRNPDFWKDYYQHVQGQIQRVSQALAGLCEAAPRGEFTFPDRIRLAELMQAALDGKAKALRKRHVRVETKFSDIEAEIRGDAGKIRRLFDMLLEEAAGHSAIGRTLKVHLRTRAGWAQLELNDSGRIFSREDLRAVLDPLSVGTRESEAFALNLLVCYLIVYHHGGKVEIHDWEDGTSSLILFFPTDPSRTPSDLAEDRFYDRVLMNDTLWERILAEY